MKIIRYELCRPSASPFWPVPPLIFSSFVRFYRKFNLFQRKFDHFYVNFHIFSESAAPSEVPPGRLAPSAPLSTPLPTCTRGSLEQSDVHLLSCLYLYYWPYLHLLLYRLVLQFSPGWSSKCSSFSSSVCFNVAAASLIA